jgi:YbbR domain-containing protein
VIVAIEPRERFRLVSVVPNLEGEEQLADGGYRLTDVSVTPEVITVFSSDPTALEGLPGFVLTSPFDLSGATGDLERRLSLDLPDGVSPVEDQGVLVKVSISPVEGTITVNRLVEIRGLTDGLFAALSPDAVEIILNGPLPTLNSLQLEDVRVIVDLLDLDVGVHQIPALIIIAPTDVENEPVFPSTIEITISADPPPTPTPPP